MGDGPIDFVFAIPELPVRNYKVPGAIGWVGALIPGVVPDVAGHALSQLELHNHVGVDLIGSGGATDELGLDGSDVI